MEQILPSPFHFHFFDGGGGGATSGGRGKKDRSVFSHCRRGVVVVVVVVGTVARMVRQAFLFCHAALSLSAVRTFLKGQRGKNLKGGGEGRTVGGPAADGGGRWRRRRRLSSGLGQFPVLPSWAKDILLLHFSCTHNLTSLSFFKLQRGKNIK